MANAIEWGCGLMRYQLPEPTSELDECNCSCHQNVETMHIVPCCRTCSRCQRRVRAGWWELHLTNCPAKHNAHSESGA